MVKKSSVPVLFFSVLRSQQRPSILPAATSSTRHHLFLYPTYHPVIVLLDHMPTKMFHARKTKNIKDLPLYGGLKPQASAATKKVIEPSQVKATPVSKLKRKLELSPNDGDLRSQFQPEKRMRRARELNPELGTLTEKSPKTPENKVRSDLEAEDNSPPKSTESDEAIRLLVEERMNKDARCRGATEKTRAIIMKARCEAERKKARTRELREKREKDLGWSSFRSRLERGGLPLPRVRGAETKEEPAGPAKPRYDSGSDLLAKPTTFDALRAKFEKGEMKRREMVKRVGEELKKAKEELIGAKTRACEGKKARLARARGDLLAATRQIKQELDGLKRRRLPEAGEARRALRAKLGRQAEQYAALMAEHKLAFDEATRAEEGLAALRSEVAGLPTGDPEALSEFREKVDKSAAKAVEELETKEKEGLRKQLKGEKKALRALQRC
ncbi:hypothetical protein TWF730_002401 [Orbilia blumenaviensis]|uniref:Uncharacterized protein n=1 Tax=Orbilia blumenaviensis TaxID=1796055 RepID=A0AAV9UAL8_9PEZI